MTTSPISLSMATIPTPVGPLTLVVHDDELVASLFGADDASVLARLDPALRGATLQRHTDLGEFTAAMHAYLDGDLTAPDALAVRQPGGDFRQAAWKAMRAVPPGETVSYAELAARAGSPGAVRAAGSACATNMIAPVVPCHRVVRTGGSLGGYAYGLDLKVWLLAHEGALLA